MTRFVNILLNSAFVTATLISAWVASMIYSNAWQAWQSGNLDGPLIVFCVMFAFITLLAVAATYLFWNSILQPAPAETEDDQEGLSTATKVAVATTLMTTTMIN